MKKREVWIEIDMKQSEVVSDYIDKSCRKKERNDGSYIGKEEKWNGQEREGKSSRL